MFEYCIEILLLISDIFFFACLFWFSLNVVCEASSSSPSPSSWLQWKEHREPGRVTVRVCLQESQIIRIFGTMINQKLQDFEEEVKPIWNMVTEATLSQ